MLRISHPNRRILYEQTLSGIVWSWFTFRLFGKTHMSYKKKIDLEIVYRDNKKTYERPRHRLLIYETLSKYMAESANTGSDANIEYYYRFFAFVLLCCAIVCWRIKTLYSNVSGYFKTIQSEKHGLFFSILIHSISKITLC